MSLSWLIVCYVFVLAYCLSHVANEYIFVTKNVTVMPRDTPATPPTRIGKLQDLTIKEDTPNEAEIHLWTHGEDDEEMVRAMLDVPEDAEDPQEAFKQRCYVLELFYSFFLYFTHA